MATNHPQVRVTNANVVAGNGLVAQQNFKKGALILDENAFFQCDTRKQPEEQNREVIAFYDEEVNKTTARLTTAYTQLSWQDREAFHKLYTSKTRATDVEHLVDRCRYNAFNFRDYTGVGIQHTRLVVYRTISFANHSCIPNAVLYIDENGADLKGYARLVATRQIDAGEEILINYIAEDWEKSRDARQAALMLGWGFDCSCKACAPRLEPDASERTLCYTYSNVEGQISCAKLRIYVDLLHELGVRDQLLSSAYNMLADNHFMQRKYKEAAYYARSGLLVELHFYAKSNLESLLAVYCECIMKDSSIHAEIEES
ncbi:hypothetical protein J4E89_009585 [Alternaria sp. Ai002NY15]|nr:hypothetical protein J4E89_009585 [Alternaria sp. Ai002NY15]